MFNVGKYKWLVCSVAVFVLLSFFYMKPPTERQVPGHAVLTGTHTAAAGYTDGAVESRAAVSSFDLISAADSEVPDHVDRITGARALLSEIIMREQNATGGLLVRFLAVLAILLFLIWIICRIAIRRFDCRRIALWQNIYYIHQIDGEKERHFCEYIG